MTTDSRQERSEDRWEQLVEADALGELSGGERAELEMLAAQDPSRQMERQVLAELPDLLPLDSKIGPDDRALIEKTIAQHAGQRKKKARWLVAAIVAVPLAAAAAYAPFIADAPESTPDAATRAPDAPALPATQPPQPPELHGEPPASPEPAPEPTATPARAKRPSAAELLARAQRLRSARDYRGAVRAYQRLIRRHPASSEARLAQVSLAQLQLTQGDPEAALAGFDAYQRRGGSLAQEAHYGKIQALRALGRTDQERAEIRRFLAHYPKALQSSALKRRLGAVGDGE
jgi:TolA-binding protein